MKFTNLALFPNTVKPFNHKLINYYELMLDRKVQDTQFEIK